MQVSFATPESTGEADSADGIKKSASETKTSVPCVPLSNGTCVPPENVIKFVLNYFIRIFLLHVFTIAYFSIV